MSKEILAELYKVLQSRKATSPEHSYVSSLFTKGVDKIAEKLNEECEETIIEAQKLARNKGDLETRTALVAEAADLTFHLLVLLAHYDIPPDEILSVLEKRFGISGHDEKASRTK